MTHIDCSSCEKSLDLTRAEHAERLDLLHPLFACSFTKTDAHHI